MFRSPGRSDPEEKDVRDDEYVDVMDMGSLSYNRPVRIRAKRKTRHAVQHRTTGTATGETR